MMPDPDLLRRLYLVCYSCQYSCLGVRPKRKRIRKMARKVLVLIVRDPCSIGVIATKRLESCAARKDTKLWRRVVMQATLSRVINTACMVGP